MQKASSAPTKKVTAGLRPLVNEFLDKQKREREQFCITHGIAMDALNLYDRGVEASLKPKSRWHEFEGSETLKEMYCEGKSFSLLFSLHTLVSYKSDV